MQQTDGRVSRESRLKTGGHGGSKERDEWERQRIPRKKKSRSASCIIRSPDINTTTATEKCNSDDKNYCGLNATKATVILNEVFHFRTWAPWQSVTVMKLHHHDFYRSFSGEINSKPISTPHRQHTANTNAFRHTNVDTAARESTCTDSTAQIQNIQPHAFVGQRRLKPYTLLQPDWINQFLCLYILLFHLFFLWKIPTAPSPEHKWIEGRLPKDRILFHSKWREQIKASEVSHSLV